MSLSLFHKTFLLLLLLLVFFPGSSFAAENTIPEVLPEGHALPWWAWSSLLFVFCFILGIVAIIAGVGGGILYVPIVGAVFPFHMDFVRGSGLLVALAGALSAAPRLLGTGMASLRLALPMALSGSIGSIIGARLGLALPSHIVEISLGTVIAGIVALMLVARRADYPHVRVPDALSIRMGIGGDYVDASTGKSVHWNIHRLLPGFVLFLIIGFMAGMFGLGAGWANVPALNLLLGAPLKVSVATSILIIAINGSAASWVYLNQGAVVPIIAVPSVLGMMLGTRLGAGLMAKTRPASIRWIVIGFLILAGLRSILSGSGVLS